MLRFVFWSLLFLNAALFAYAQGFFGTSKGSEEERARIKPQLEAARLTVLTNEQAAAAKAAPAAASEAASEAAIAPAAAAVEASAPAVAASAAAKPLACIDVGTFSTGEAKRFETRLAALDLGERQSRQAVQAQDVTSYLVNIPPQGSKEAAERKAGELRNLGVTNFFIMSGDSPLKWAISLGVFKTENGAQTLLAQLNKQGVHTARITPRGREATRYAYRFRDIEPGTRERIVAAADAVSDAEAKSCR
ncbi:SPOR domain-containing protein [Massilia sp. LXY-6]|uniref:SPOR domain-containing protein n=1 Tax=Massilia sp. LXY-6 TaxID=3379823 RepID=UPI003EE0BE80